MGTARQVFFDPSGRRARTAAIAGYAALFALVAVFGGLLAAILTIPVLPSVNLPHEKSATLSANAPAPDALPFVSARKHAVSPAAAARVRRQAFYVNWDEHSFISLQKNAASLDTIFAEWLHIKGTSGEIQHNDWEREAEVRAWLGREAPALEVLSLINNYNGGTGAWDGQAVAALLLSPGSRARLIEELLGYVREGKFPGVVIDFEQIAGGATKNLTVFVRELSARFSPLGLKVLTAVPAGDPAIEYEAIAATSSQLILMAYDEHDDTSAVPGPVASQGWFEARLDEWLKPLGCSKLIVALGSYGHDWKAGSPGSTISVQTAWDLADEAGARLGFDAGALNPSFAYTDGKTGERHDVWFLDAATAFNEAAAAMAQEPYGIALWRLGSEDPSIWQVIGKGRLPDASSATALAQLMPGYDLTYRGAGEVLQVTGLEKLGRRRVAYSADTNLIGSESIEAFPKAVTVTRWGARTDKTVSLTFDDGPDPASTPAILDILAAKKVHGAFFAVGANVTARPDILRRIYAEGHDVGNHTYSHPDLAAIHRAEVDLELNATQRTIEAALGIRTLLFRPPYVGDVAPETATHMKPLSTATALGYLTVSSGIDPFDWTLISADEIVKRAVSQVEEGRGHIILLHDAGGNRSHTAAALPKLIDALREKGYRFVTVPELLELPRDELMPKTGAGPAALVSKAGFGLLRWFGIALNAGLFLGLALGLARLALISVLAVWHKRQERRRKGIGWTPPSLAVILPAFNEEKVICNAVRSLLASEMTGFDIIVVDDGSTDRTAAVVSEAFAGIQHVKLWRRPNGGKAAALNYALEKTRHEIVIIADADTIFEPSAVPILVRHFQDPLVAAVAGTVKVSNRVNWLSRFQALEYVTCQNLERRAQEMLDGIFVVPGCFGAWRRQELIAVGGISPATFAEDADATIKLQRKGLRVIYEPGAVSLTEVPQTIGQFFNQRIRWMYGCLQTAWMHRSALWRLDAKGIAFFTLPNIVIYQVFFVLISPVIDLVLVWSVFMATRSYLMHPADRVPAGLYLALFFWSAFQFVEMGAAILAFSIESTKGNWWRLLPLTFIQRFWYRQLLYWVALVTLARIAKGRFYNWDKLRRYGAAATLARSPSPAE